MHPARKVEQVGHGVLGWMELQLGAFGFRLVHFNGPRDQQREAEERIGVGQRVSSAGARAKSRRDAACPISTG